MRIGSFGRAGQGRERVLWGGARGQDVCFEGKG